MKEDGGKMLSIDSIKNKVKAIFVIGVVDMLMAGIIAVSFGNFITWVMFFLGMFGGLCFGIGWVFYFITNQLDKMKIKPEDLAGLFQEEENQ